MKKTGIFLPVMFFLFSSGLQVSAQNSSPASAGKISGLAENKVGPQAGTANSTTAMPNTVLLKIVEHTYEITAIVGINDNDIYVEPFSNSYQKKDSLALRIDNYDPEYLSYRVFDFMGNLQCSDSTRGFETKIPVQNIPSGEYFLKVMYGKKELKTFKVIKN